LNLPVRKRRSARVLLLDKTGRVLLLRFVIPRSDGKFEFWAAPGGAVEPGESDAAAAEREVLEELGLRIRVGRPVHRYTGEFEFEGYWNQSTDVFFAARMPDAQPVLAGINDAERSTLREWRWWTAEEIRGSITPLFPRELAEVVEATIKAMSHQINCEPLKELVRTVPDFPKPGILFYDITTLLKDKAGFAQMIDAFAAYYIDQKIDLVLGIEARGFIFGPAMAYRLNAGFVPVRKPHKLPAPTARVTYDLEYGSDTLEIHVDAIQPGQRVVIVDDLLATGGTMQATVQLVKQLGGEIVGVAFAVELDFLKGRQKFPGVDVYSLLHYSE